MASGTSGVGYGETLSLRNLMHQSRKTQTKARKLYLHIILMRSNMSTAWPFSLFDPFVPDKRRHTALSLSSWWEKCPSAWQPGAASEHDVVRAVGFNRENCLRLQLQKLIPFGGPHVSRSQNDLDDIAVLLPSHLASAILRHIADMVQLSLSSEWRPTRWCQAALLEQRILPQESASNGAALCR